MDFIPLPLSHNRNLTDDICKLPPPFKKDHTFSHKKHSFITDLLNSQSITLKIYSVSRKKYYHFVLKEEDYTTFGNHLKTRCQTLKA